VCEDEAPWVATRGESDEGAPCHLMRSMACCDHNMATKGNEYFRTPVGALIHLTSQPLAHSAPSLVLVQRQGSGRCRLQRPHAVFSRAECKSNRVASRANHPERDSSQTVVRSRPQISDVSSAGRDRGAVVSELRSSCSPHCQGKSDRSKLRTVPSGTRDDRQGTAGL